MNQVESDYDPLLECLVIFAKLFNRPVSVDALIAGLPVGPDENGPELFSINSSKGMFSRVAKRAGFASRLIKRELMQLDGLLLPCILILKNRNACILEEIDARNKRAKVIFPEVGEGEEWVPLDQLEEQYMGFAFLLKSEYQQRAAQTSQLKVNQGHWFWDTLDKSKDVFFSVLMASLLINLFAIATPLFTMNVYDRVVPNDALETLWVLAIGVALVYIFDTALRFIRTYFLETAGKKSDVIMSSILFEQVLNLKMDHWPKSIGAFASNLRDFESIRNFFTASTLATLVDLPFAILLLLIVFYIGGAIVAIPLITMLLLLLYSAAVVKPLRRSVESVYEASANKNAHLIESLSAIQTIKALGASHHAQWVWEESSGDIAEKSMNSRMLSNSISVVTNLLTQLNTVAIIIFGIYMIGDLELSLGGLIAVVMLSSRAVSPMGQVATLITQYHQTRAAYDNLNELMKKPVERSESKPYVRRPSFEGQIECKHMSFTYPEAQSAALEDISISIQPKEHVGIIGKVGSGKSSFAKLLLSLYEPSSGSLSIDGININQIDPADLRMNIGYLSQDVQLVHGTIRDNLIYRNPKITDERLLEVSALCGVDQFVNRLPSGFDTQVGEQGVSLSGGQRQAIGLGRAMLLGESILVLDEPTSHMDNTTESVIRKNLYEYTRDRTLVLVTHKAAMLDLVERLIVIDQGRVLMDGPKAEVMAALKGKNREA
ncbi:MAG: type I secretion system permease/ATPase [Oleiphilus sp.]|nr:MAG: type I secretion system permease/ATPase [Oleiphilus sp.]